jgi:hypothetical protein
MTTLMEALAAERAKRQQEAADKSTMEQVARSVLEALADRLNAEAIPGWMFLFEGQQVHIARVSQGSRQQLGAWTMSSNMQLVCGEGTTQWITSESYGRALDEAMQITAKLIVDAETADAARRNNGPQLVEASQSAKAVELPA